MLDKEQLREKLKTLKQKGLTYKGIAMETGLTPAQLYEFMRTAGPATAVVQKLNEYFKEDT